MEDPLASLSTRPIERARTLVGKETMSRHSHDAASTAIVTSVCLHSRAQAHSVVPGWLGSRGGKVTLGRNAGWMLNVRVEKPKG